MKKNSLFTNLLFLLGLAFLLTHCTDPAPAEEVDVTADIQALNEGFRTDFKNADANALATRYTEDGKIYPPNSEMMQGREAISAYWQGAMDAGLTDAALTTVSAMAYGDMAVEVGTADIYAGDGQLVDKAKFMVVWKKVDGEWKMHEDIWNSSMPLPEPEPAAEATPAEDTPGEDG